MSPANIETDSSVSKNPYEVSRERIAALTSRLLAERPPEGDDRFVCYMLDGGDEYSDIGRAIESEVFSKTFDNSPEEMRREYGPYEQKSTFFVSIDREAGIPTGTIRIGRNGAAGFKSMNDLERLDSTYSLERVREYRNIDDLDKCWDILTLAVAPEYRSAQGNVSVQLYRGVYLAAMEQGIEHFISIIDSRAYEKVTGYTGIPYVPMLDSSETFEYLNSQKSLPIYGYVPDFYRKMNRKRWTLKGILARKVLSRLVEGSQDSEFQFDSPIKNI